LKWDTYIAKFDGYLDAPFADRRGIARILPVHQVSEDLNWIRGALDAD
jgi:hypothetical protein